MFTLKAIDGDLNLSGFDLSALTNKANLSAQEIKHHNQQVYEKFRELVVDYMNKINDVMLDDLELPSFETGNKEFYIYNTAMGLHIKFYFGHGRGSVHLEFKTPYEGKKLSYEFKGVISVIKHWHDKVDNQNHNLESVAQLFEVSADVLKLHIIQRDVKDFYQQKELEKQLTY